jgi:hypothetical protein
MSIDVSSIQTFTAAQLLSLVEYGIASIMAGGQSYSIGGRQFNRASLKDLIAWRDTLKGEVALDAGSTDDSTGITLVSFGEPA